MAGTAVDVALFPIDTIKTRLQAPQGFVKAGGFSGVYNGLLSAAIGSAPGAALFFCSYEKAKGVIGSATGRGRDDSIVVAASSSVGEAMACLVRVPTENVKQKMQAGVHSRTSDCLRAIMADGPAGFYRGFGTTVMREIPFSMIQFPMYEKFKSIWGDWRGAKVDPWQASLCGSLSGGISAAVTTPLDVAKTRLMLPSKDGPQYSGTVSTIQRIASEEGVGALFKGVGPRVMWISIGGCVFLGVYEKARSQLIDVV